MFSSMNQKWRTPTLLYKRLNEEFHFDFDPCPSDPTFNGLHIDWKERNFVNPPYRDIKEWVYKAWTVSQLGKLVVLLLPSRTDTLWFHRYVLPYASEIRFLKGRLYFNNSKNPAPFPSMIVIFG